MNDLSCPIITDTPFHKSVVENISDMKMSVEVALTTLNELLILDKLDRGLLALEYKDVKLLDFLRNTIQPFYTQAAAKHISMYFIFDDVLHDHICEDEKSQQERGTNLVASPPNTRSSANLRSSGCGHGSRAVSYEDALLRADPNKLAQVIRNLVSNALKFTPMGGTVRIHASITVVAAGFLSLPRIATSENQLSQPYLKFDVVDTGPGLSAVSASTCYVMR